MEKRAIEVGNIFPLGTKYSEAFNLRFTDERGEKKYVVMGSYGIGLGRTMGTAVEVFHDGRGIVWPENIAPFKAHLISINRKQKTEDRGQKIYDKLQKAGVEVLYDDREGVSAGEKFNDADLIGIPYRLVISDKTKNEIEVKRRDSDEMRTMNLEKILKLL